MRVRGTLRAPQLFAQLTGIGIPRCLKRSGFPVRIRGWAPDIELPGAGKDGRRQGSKYAMVGSTGGVRPGLISLGERPDGLQRQGSSPWPTTNDSPSWTNRESRRVQTAEPRKAYCQFESGRGDQGFALFGLPARLVLPRALSLNSALDGHFPSGALFSSVARMVRHPPSKRDFMRIRLPPDGPPFRECLGVVVAQRPKAPRCDRGKHGFESHRPPPSSRGAPQA